VTRVGVVDLGTNSTRLLVADVANGRVEELERRLTITRLGEGVDARRQLIPTAIARVRNVLGDYRRAIEALGAERTLAIGTSAVRDSENGEAFLGEVEWSYGFETRLLTGRDEALLNFRGVASDRSLDEATLVVDVGGGSTELIAGGPDGVAFQDSVDLGCVRLTERFLASDPPAQGQLDACAEHVRALLAERVPESVQPKDAIGVAGTVTTLATLDLRLEEEVPELVHGHRLTAAWIEGQVARLASMPVAEIRALRGMHPDRAAVILAGTLVVRETLRRFDLDELETSERDILHGAALEAAELPERPERDAPPGAYTCC
jgi:exopolyphosphatase / guanosine-5'-triphosphate,3'-diphosphate pyrophosphatase